MDKLEKILDIIDHQDKYSDEEVREILQDEECRKLYQTMMEVDSALVKNDLKAKASVSEASDNKSSQVVDIDEEWKKFSNSYQLSEATSTENVSPTICIRQNNPARKSSWHKIAASVAGFVLISGIAFAAIHTYIKRSQEPMPIAKGSQTEVVAKDSAKQDAVKDSLTQVKAEKTAIHKTFENVSFDKMMTEIAAYYDMQVKFDNAEAKSLRLYYEWDSHSSIESIVKELNQFENVNIEMEGQTLVVK